MPRGVYARKSAQPAEPEAKPAVKAKAQPQAKKTAKPPTPAVKAKAPAPVAPATQAEPPKLQLVSPQQPVAPSFYRNKRVNVDSISGDVLKTYARSLGIQQRDVDGLTEDRLRQNCKARIIDSMED